MHKAKGMVRDVFRTRNMRACRGTSAWPGALPDLATPTAKEAQPFYVNAPFGIVLVHNGNLTNAQALKAELFDRPPPHQHRERHRGAAQRARPRAGKIARARPAAARPRRVQAVGVVHKRVRAPTP